MLGRVRGIMKNTGFEAVECGETGEETCLLGPGPLISQVVQKPVCASDETLLNIWEGRDLIEQSPCPSLSLPHAVGPTYTSLRGL